MINPVSDHIHQELILAATKHHKAKGKLKTRSTKTITGQVNPDVQTELVIESIDTPHVKLGMTIEGSWVNVGSKGAYVTMKDYQDDSKAYATVDEMVYNIVPPDQLEMIGGLIVLNSSESIKRFYPKMYNAMMTFILIEDSNCPTLYVTYNSLVGKVELHYNPAFIAMAALIEYGHELLLTNPTRLGNLTPNDTNDYIVCVGTFFFMHELYHVLYRHVNNPDSVLPASIENYPEDAFINSLLMDVYRNNPILSGVLDKLGKQDFALHAGITKSYVITGTINPNLVKFDRPNMYQYEELVAQYIRENTRKGMFARPETRNLEGDHNKFNLGDKIRIHVNHVASPIGMSYESYSKSLTDLLAILLDTNSATNTKSTAPTLNNPDDGGGTSSRNDNRGGDGNGDSTKPGDNGKPDDNSNSDNSNGNGQGSSGQSKVGNGQGGDDDNQGQGDSNSQPSNTGGDSDAGSTSGSPGSGSGGAGDNQATSVSSDGPTGFDNRNKLKDSIPDTIDKQLTDAAREVADTLEKTAGQVNPDTSSVKGISQDLQKVLSARDGNTTVAKAWRQKLRRMIEQAAGIQVNYNPDAPNARIQGQFGREVIDSKLRDIIFSFDISGSMDVTDFKGALTYIEDMMRMGLNFERVGFSYWTSGHWEVAPRRLSPKAVYRTAISQCPDYRGTTPIRQAINSFLEGKLRSAKPDLIIIFTDGEISTDGLKDVHYAWLRKNRKKILWCLKAGAKTAGINAVKRLDPTCEKRMVIMTDNRAIGR